MRRIRLTENFHWSGLLSLFIGTCHSFNAFSAFPFLYPFYFYIFYLCIFGGWPDGTARGRGGR